jgi:hypothetical protein
LVLGLLLLLAAGLLLTPQREARAEGTNADTNTYFAEVRYYDSIQMKYVVQHGIDQYWTTTGDIPIGGFIDGTGNQLLDQAYCVDATIPFHGSSETKTTWPRGVTTDTTTQGYVVASPLAVSESVRANLPSLYWLAVNGFRGELKGDNNLADIRNRYAGLEGHYGTTIDATIAVMATKAAVWNFTDPTFALLSTSLIRDTAHPTAEEKARYQLMVALIRSLVSDARALGTQLATTTLDVRFDVSGASFKERAPGSNNWFYGPIKPSVTSSNGTGAAEKIYLTASGVRAPDFKFFGGTWEVLVPLDKGKMYGSTQEAPYVNNGDEFYIMVPAAAASEALVNIGQPIMSFNFLVLHGLARSANVTYTDTPAIMAWQGPTSATGEQDWQHVQAFIGFVNNMQASLYGEGHLLLRGGSFGGSIDLSKKVFGATDTANAGSFAFTLEVFDNGLQQWLPVPLIPAPLAGANITGSSGLSDISPGGVFSLADGSTVKITDLPAGKYRISEQSSVDGYSTVYQLNSWPEEAGFEAILVLGGQVTTGSVAFTNTIAPKPQSITGRIDVGKLLGEAADTPLAGRFAFTLERYDETLAQWLPEPLTPEPLPDANISGNSGLSAPSADGSFTLAGRDCVSITGLSLGQYRVREQPDSTYTTTWQLNADTATAGSEATVLLDVQTPGQALSFTNALTPNTPDVPNTPDDGSGIPATGERGGARLVVLLIIALLGAANAALVIFRRRFRQR